MSKSFRMLTLSGFLLVTGLGLSTAQAAAILTYAGVTPATPAAACLNVQNGITDNFTPVQAFPCHLDFDDWWKFDGLFIYGIGTTHTSAKCLDVKFGGTADGTPVVLYDCHPGPIQQWYFYNGQLRNINSGKCLDVGNGAISTPAVIRTCNSSAAGQQWKIR